MAAPLQISERPVALPFVHQFFGVDSVETEAATAQRYAEDSRHFAQPDERRHDRIHVDFEKLRLEAFLQSARRRLRQEPAFLNETHFRAAFRFIHVMGRYENRDAAIA